MGEFIEQFSTLIERGGYVMIPLLALSIISLSLIFERSWFWVLLHGGDQAKKLRTLNAALREHDIKKAAKLLHGDRSPYARLAKRMLEHGCNDAVALEAVEVVRPRIDRFMVSLSTIITAAPLLGILGTVIGIIRSFNLLGDTEALTDTAAVSVGIAEALLTTAMGLVVALVTLFPYMAFKGQVERALGQMEALVAAAQQGESAQMTPPAESDATTSV